MDPKAETLELLSAYVCGDVTPDERAAVEQLVASDAAAQALSCELRELSETLKLGRKPVRAELLAALKRRVHEKTVQRTGELAVEALLSASLSNDLSARESELLNAHLNKNPHARAELESLRFAATQSNQGQKKLSDDFSKKLAERLNAKLPAAARVGAAARTASTVSSKSAPISGERPSLRVFAQPETHWRRTAWAGAAIAALVAFGFGLSQWNSGKTNAPMAKSPDTAPKESIEVAKAPVETTPDHRNSPESLPPPKAPDVANGPKNAPENHDVPKIAPDKTPAPVQQHELADPKTQTQPLNPQQVPQTPQKTIVNNDDVPQKPVAPPKHNVEVVGVPIQTTPNTLANTDPKTVAETNPKTTVAPNTSNTSAKTLDPNNGVDTAITNPTHTSTGGGTIAQQNPLTPDKKTMSDNNTTIAPIAGKAVVSLLSDGGNVQITTPDAKIVSAVKGLEVVSGSQINSDQSRVQLLLPGGTVWLNKSTRVALMTIGKETTLSLISGQLAFQGTGAITVNADNKAVTVSRAYDVDLKVENNALVTTVLSKSARIVYNGKTETPQAGSMVTAKFDSEPMQKSAIVKFADWHTDMDRIITSDPPAQGKNRSGTTRKK